MHSDTETRKIQYSIYKKLTAEEKIRISIGLNNTARKLKRAALEKKYPQLSAVEIEAKVRDIFLNART